MVYGAPAIAMAIPRAVSIYAEEHTALKLDIPQWNLELKPDPEGSDLARALAALVRELPSQPALRLCANIALPSGVGLGSSASLGVAVLEALNHHAHWQLSKAQRYDLLFAWERVFHGNPSGFDHATAMHHGLTDFERFRDPPIRNVPCTQDLQVIVAQIDAGASTRKMVEGVAAWNAAHPTEFQRLLERATQRAKNLHAALQRPDLSPNSWSRILGDLLQENHFDLQKIGVSTPALDAACNAAQHAGAYGAKLIGAGGGGCILALVDASCHDAVYDTLNDHSYQRFSLRLNQEVPS